MIRPLSAGFLTPTKRCRKLSVLLAIHDSPNNSQHKIGRMTQLSSSMVNIYMKKLRDAELITVSGKSHRSQSYHLSAAGRSALIALLMEYSTEIIQLYGASKREFTKRFSQMHAEGIDQVALFGAAETAEVVYAAIKETPLVVKAVVDSDPSKQAQSFNGFKIQKPEALKQMQLDAVLITSFARQEEIFNCARNLVSENTQIKRLSDL